jgi:tetratricopeptide (TPR) repeat protein
MTKKSKWKKRVIITITSFLVIILILGIIFNQLVYALLIGIGSMDAYYGNNDRGNKIMNFALSKTNTPTENTFHAISVQNTKNGNYNIAIPALEKAYKINPLEVGGYYGWVLLYYYHDYEKALNILNTYDKLTPNFNDWPMGECIHYLKGLALMQLNNYEEAIKEFNISIADVSIKHGDDWVDEAVFINKAKCLSKLNKFEDALVTLKRVISYSNKSTEAYYFMGFSQMKLNKKEEACQNYNKAYELIKDGYKSSDMYVELFHEIYEQEIEQSIAINCMN